VILVHPGGEAAAVEALRNGADTAIAEGDVLALRALAGDPDAVSSRIGNLLEAYETRLGRQSSNGSSRAAGSVISTVSGLPGNGALRARLSTAVVDADQEIRLVSIGVPGLARPHALRLGGDAAALLHRRIAIGLRNLVSGRGELFDLGEGAFVLVAPRLGVDDAERLGRAIIDLVEAYTPDAHSPLTAAIGHAGSECSTDLPTLRELSGRAELTAVSDERSAVLGAGELVGPLATATELEVTLRLAAIADELGSGPSHTAVAQVANDLAVRLGFEGTERLLVRFCAHVAGIGRVLGTERGADAPDPLVVAARHVGATAGPAVAAALLHLREHWDGSGTPDGLAGADIPAPARIIAVAEALVAGGGDLSALQEGAGTLYDPTVVAAAAELARSS
jgi:GGDEF domain-containing protein